MGGGDEESSERPVHGMHQNADCMGQCQVAMVPVEWLLHVRC